MPIKIPVTIGNNSFDLIIQNNNGEVKTRENQSTWMPLFTVLYANLSDEQRTHILRYKLDYANNIIPNTKFVFYTEVCDYYVKADSSYNQLKTGQSEHQCICGAHIAEEHFISNVNNLYTAYKIGSTCIDHWNLKEAKVMKRKKLQEKYKKKDKESTFCSNCGKKNNLKSCSCKRKNRDLMQSVFNRLRDNAEYSGRLTKVSSGRFKDVLTYFELNVSDNKECRQYIKWVLRTDIDWTGKDELIEFHNRIENKSENVIDEDFEEQIQKKLNNLSKNAENNSSNNSSNDGWWKRELKYPAVCTICYNNLCEGEEVYMKNQDKKWLFKCIECN